MEAVSIDSKKPLKSQTQEPQEEALNMIIIIKARKSLQRPNKRQDGRCAHVELSHKGAFNSGSGPTKDLEDRLAGFDQITTIRKTETERGVVSSAKQESHDKNE